jgi:hypothetical protein
VGDEVADRTEVATWASAPQSLENGFAVSIAPKRRPAGCVTLR